MLLVGDFALENGPRHSAAKLPCGPCGCVKEASVGGGRGWGELSDASWELRVKEPKSALNKASLNRNTHKTKLGIAQKWEREERLTKPGLPLPLGHRFSLLIGVQGDASGHN